MTIDTSRYGACFNERISAHPIMYSALTYDHRVVDGREAVTFLKRICDCIEDPTRMLMEA